MKALENLDPVITDKYHIRWSSKDGSWWVALPRHEENDLSLYWTSHRFDSKSAALVAVKNGLEYA